MAEPQPEPTQPEDFTFSPVTGWDYPEQLVETMLWSIHEFGLERNMVLKQQAMMYLHEVIRSDSDLQHLSTAEVTQIAFSVENQLYAFFDQVSRENNVLAPEGRSVAEITQERRERHREGLKTVINNILSSTKARFHETISALKEATHVEHEQQPIVESDIHFAETELGALLVGSEVEDVMVPADDVVLNALTSAIRQRHVEATRLEDEIALLVGQARDAGATWTKIGQLLNMTHSGAYRRYDPEGNRKNRENAKRQREREQPDNE